MVAAALYLHKADENNVTTAAARPAAVFYIWPLKVNEVWMCNGGLSLVSGLAWQRTIRRWSDSTDPAVFMETHQRPVGCEKPSSAKWAAYKTGNKTAAQRTAAADTAGGQKVTRWNTAEYSRRQQSTLEYFTAYSSARYSTVEYPVEYSEEYSGTVVLEDDGESVDDINGRIYYMSI